MRPGWCSPRTCAHLCHEVIGCLPARGLRDAPRLVTQMLETQWPSPRTGWCCRNVPERSPSRGSAERGSEPTWALGTRCGRGSPASLESHAAPAPALPPPPVPLPAGNAPAWVLITGHAGPGEVSSAEIDARSGPRWCPQRGLTGLGRERPLCMPGAHPLHTSCNRQSQIEAQRFMTYCKGEQRPVLMAQAA